MKVHLIAIGGSIMHNLAIALKKSGDVVTGSDDEIYEPALSRLQRHNIAPESFGWHPEKITNDIDVVILGMHAKADNSELLKAQSLGLKIVSFPEFIYQRSQSKKRIVVAGSHGKTTVTSMLMHILHHLNIDFDYAVGSQVEGFEDSIKLTNNAKWIVIEGDEYLSSTLDKRPKFVWYQPDLLLINGIDWDHINVFPTYQIYLAQFENLIKDCRKGSYIIANAFDDDVISLVENTPSEANKQNAIHFDYEVVDGKFIVSFDNNKYPMQVFGKHNIANLSGAVTLCSLLGIDVVLCLSAMESFKGAAKRLEILFQSDSLIVYRDFAHAPSKTKATVQAVKEKHPNQPIIAFQELHTFSSLNPHYIVQYAGCLDGLSKSYVFIHPDVQASKVSYPITSEFIKKSFANDDITFIQSETVLKEEVEKALATPNAVVLLMSSGKFAGLDFVKMCNK